MDSDFTGQYLGIKGYLRVYFFRGGWKIYPLKFLKILLELLIKLPKIRFRQIPSRFDPDVRNSKANKIKHDILFNSALPEHHIKYNFPINVCINFKLDYKINDGKYRIS